MTYYFIGDRVRGAELLDNLSDIAYEQHKRATEKCLGIPAGSYHNFVRCIESDGSIGGFKFNANPRNVGGSRGKYVYYLKDMTIRRARKRSLKGLWIRLFGTNVAKL